jgi:hypothetical protein
MILQSVRWRLFLFLFCAISCKSEAPQSILDSDVMLGLEFGLKRDSVRALMQTVAEVSDSSLKYLRFSKMPFLGRESTLTLGFLTTRLNSVAYRIPAGAPDIQHLADSLNQEFRDEYGDPDTDYSKAEKILATWNVKKDGYSLWLTKTEKDFEFAIRGWPRNKQNKITPEDMKEWRKLDSLDRLERKQLKATDSSVYEH